MKASDPRTTPSKGASQLSPTVLCLVITSPLTWTRDLSNLPNVLSFGGNIAVNRSDRHGSVFYQQPEPEQGKLTPSARGARAAG